MIKKIVSLSAGIAMLAVATIVPVMAQTSGNDSSDINVDVNDFLTFAIANPTGDACATAAGDCPFAGTGAAADLTSTGSNDSVTASVDGVVTQLATTTNSTDGYNVTAYAADDAGARTNALLRSGGTAGTAADEISDSVQVVQAAQAANAALNASTDTGLALRLRDTTTSTILREADEDTQWGDGDAGTALWASAPLGSGAAALIYDTTTYSGTATTAYIDWFVGVDSAQQTGVYSGQVTFTASVN